MTLRLIPGAGFVDESGSALRLIPGAGFVNESVSAGGVTLTPSLFTNTNSFYAPTITPGAVTLTPSLFTNSNIFYGPTVTASYTLQPSLYENTNTFYSPTVVGNQTISVPLVTNANTFYAATVTGGAQTELQPDTHDGADYTTTYVTTKRRKQSRTIRKELERLFEGANRAVERIECAHPVPQAQETSAPISMAARPAITPLLELQTIIAELYAIQEAMTGPQMARFIEVQQQAIAAEQARRMYNIRARAALLAA